MFLTYSTAPRPFAVRSVYRNAPRYGQSFHWLEAGSKHDQAIVLVHGLLAHSMAYRKIVPKLAGQYRLIIPDLPAHGRDETFRCDDLPPKIDTLGEWLDELLATVESDHIHLVGHSLGALMAFLAARRPHGLSRVESVTLTSPGIRIGVPGWMHRLVGMIPFGLANLAASSVGVRMYEPIQWRKSRMTNAEIDSYVQPFRQPERLEFMIAMGTDLLRKPDRLEGAERIDHPTLLVWGDKDHLLPLKTGHTLQSSIADARLEVLEGAGHCPMEDAPDQFSRALDQFLTHQGNP